MFLWCRDIHLWLQKIWLCQNTFLIHWPIVWRPLRTTEKRKKTSENIIIKNSINKSRRLSSNQSILTTMFGGRNMFKHEHLKLKKNTDTRLIRNHFLANQQLGVTGRGVIYHSTHSNFWKDLMAVGSYWINFVCQLVCCSSKSLKKQ